MCQVQGVEPADWVMSVEMAEHVPKSLEAAVVANLHWLNTKGIVLTWALPGQPGSGHINGRSNRYVHSLLHQLGYTRDAEAEAVLRGTVNRYRMAGSTAEHSELSWNANTSELRPPLGRERAWVRESIARLAGSDGRAGRAGREGREGRKDGEDREGSARARVRQQARLYSSSAAGAEQLKTMAGWINLCPWLGDTLMVYRRPAGASAQQLQQPVPSLSHGRGAAARREAARVEARSEVVARARQHVCSQQRTLRGLAGRARSEFGRQLAGLYTHLNTSGHAVQAVRRRVASHLLAFDQLALELQPEALAGCSHKAT